MLVREVTWKHKGLLLLSWVSQYVMLHNVLMFISSLNSWKGMWPLARSDGLWSVIFGGPIHLHYIDSQRWICEKCLCSSEKQKFYTSGMARGWVNDQRILIFWVENPFKFRVMRPPTQSMLYIFIQHSWYADDNRIAAKPLSWNYHPVMLSKPRASMMRTPGESEAFDYSENQSPVISPAMHGQTQNIEWLVLQHFLKGDKRRRRRLYNVT